MIVWEDKGKYISRMGKFDNVLSSQMLVPILQLKFMIYSNVMLGKYHSRAQKF